MKFRKKPVVIEAMQLTRENYGDVKSWCGGAYWSRPPMRAVTGITIATLEGDMHASYGDWIIRGVQGEFYPCKPDIFEATYEPVEGDEGDEGVSPEALLRNLCAEVTGTPVEEQSGEIEDIAIGIRVSFRNLKHGTCSLVDCSRSAEFCHPCFLAEAEEVQERTALLTSVCDDAAELLEVAALRGDDQLPHPADDPGLWTARAQEAWDRLRESVDAVPDVKATEIGGAS